MKPRNPLVVPARKRKGGVIKSRKHKIKEKELEKEIEEWRAETDETY